MNDAALIEVMARAIHTHIASNDAMAVEAAQAALAALRAAGWAVVPVKPTAEMLEAWADEGLTQDELTNMWWRYENMLSAATPARGET